MNTETSKLPAHLQGLANNPEFQEFINKLNQKPKVKIYKLNEMLFEEGIKAFNKIDIKTLKEIIINILNIYESSYYVTYRALLENLKTRIKDDELNDFLDSMPEVN